ncbi:MAG: agmatinase [Deinococcota bacterium]|nr:agmatinase [Allomeiothermus silvanus]
MRYAELQPGMVAVIGLPLDENSSFLHGAAQAPAKIRKVLLDGSSNLCAESGLDLGTHPGWRDLGDVQLGSPEAPLAQIESAVAGVLERGARLLSLGGDHSVTYPVLRAFSRHYPNLTVLHLDAHPDLYDELDGNRYSHACPFARVMEEGLVRRLVQAGIRTLNPHQRQQARRFGVEVLEMKDWRGELPALDGPLYLSLDLDVLDPAFAPGVSHHEPGGLSVREVLRILQRLEVPLVGADIVELNPLRDVVDMTAKVAAKFYKELVARMLG